MVCKGFNKLNDSDIGEMSSDSTNLTLHHNNAKEKELTDDEKDDNKNRENIETNFKVHYWMAKEGGQMVNKTTV